MVKAIVASGGRLALELAHQMHESERARERASRQESRAAAKQRQVPEQLSKAERAAQSARARLGNQATQQQACSQACPAAVADAPSSISYCPYISLIQPRKYLYNKACAQCAIRWQCQRESSSTFGALRRI